mmetsp:Transcript_49076/g.116803  ORF Transcript_49076/g.116803 Transcript_49076/m.116803 type:complete len:702 (-) Transcript_49076:112-2217(-)|eukprot:CAMPEP_0178389666 /NCGR_PEP_ID=MMETSP0689_2-20121128/10242_1 /TAXON_ID=160604 /ORGANISM="Amphidinium massartii, Strain CS-259" /LENGTH=701 /DNA_ID=CAMNT_0020010139 /DNA_START=67 /DNA_END=2172 /DNA_ORIENTATION=+
MASSSSSSRARGENAVPVDFVCPITQQVMQNPSMAADGFSYEREAIQAWLNQSSKSPMTNVELPNRELLDNRALKASIEAFSQATGRLESQVDMLTQSHVEKDACLRILAADLKRAEAKEGMQVNLLEYERLVSENALLKSKLRFAEESLGGANASSKRRRLSQQGGEAEVTQGGNDTSSSSHNPPPQASGAGDSAEQDDAPLDDARAHVAELIDTAQKEVAGRRQRLQAKLAFLQTSHAEASAATEKHDEALAQQEKEVEQDEAKVTSARVKLSATYVDMEEKSKERDAKAKLCSELSGPAMAEKLLSEVEESPEKYAGGHFGDYGRLHQEWKALQEQHGQEKACISVLEAAANTSRGVLEGLKAKCTASKDAVEKLDSEIKVIEAALAEEAQEESNLWRKKEQLSKSFDVTFGPGGTLPSSVARLPPSNMTLVPMLEDIVASRVKKNVDDHMSALRRYMAKQHDERIARQDDMTKRAIVGLCHPPVSRALKTGGFSITDLMDLGYTAQELLDGGCADVEVARCLCKPLPKPPAAKQGAVVTHIFRYVKHARHLGSFHARDSTELTFADVTNPSWRYSFHLQLYPNGDTEESKGGCSFYFKLSPGPNSSSLPWPMKKERFTIKLRMLAAVGTSAKHEERVLDGVACGGFAEYLSGRVPPRFAGDLFGFSQFLSAQQAGSGAFFLGEDKDYVAVQCELRLR